MARAYRHGRRRDVATPLLRFDVGTLYNEFFGETKRNLSAALRAAEAMAPCVLWIDEIEKAMLPVITTTASRGVF